MFSVVSGGLLCLITLLEFHLQTGFTSFFHECLKEFNSGHKRSHARIFTVNSAACFGWFWASLHDVKGYESFIFHLKHKADDLLVSFPLENPSLSLYFSFISTAHHGANCHTKSNRCAIKHWSILTKACILQTLQCYLHGHQPAWRWS